MKQGNGIGRIGMQVAVGCGIALGALTYLPSAAAQSKTLYVGMNGGVMERTYVDHVFPAFEKEKKVKVVVAPRPPPSKCSQSIVDRASPICTPRGVKASRRRARSVTG